MTSIFKQSKQLIVLSTPLLVAKFGVPLRCWLLTWIFAQLGEQTLAAATLVLSFLFVVTTFFIGTLMSSVGFSIAYAIGAGDEQKAFSALQYRIDLKLLGLHYLIMLLLVYRLQMSLELAYWFVLNNQNHYETPAVICAD